LDVLLFNNADGGDIEVKNGVVTLTDSIETAVLLSLFGGNDDDDASDATASKIWWGSLEETDTFKRQRSETQFLLRSLPIIPANLRRIEDAAVRDLAWLTATKVATFVRARATMPALNRVKLEVFITVDGTVYTFVFKPHDPAPLGTLMYAGGAAPGASPGQMMDGGEGMTDDGEPMTD
jgi:phage gp46-like protein